MKYAISVDSKNKDEIISSVFGRCKYFAIFDKKGTDIEFVDNPGNSQSRGAGMSAAQFVVDQGVANVISGNIGPNAKNVLINAGIKIDIKEKVPLKTILEELSKNENKE